jgi:hypothetical protein
MKLRIFALTLTASAFAFAQNPITADSTFQVHYASNLTAGDSVINISNTGAMGSALATGTSATVTGSICVNVYTFAPDEQEVSCCSCPVTPNGLVSLSVKNDLINNVLTPAVPTSVIVKLLATTPAGGSCSGSAAVATAANLATGLVAWGTTVHPGVAAGTFDTTETAFTPASLSAGELAKLTTLCNFNIVNGSGFGVCNSCRAGGLGASKL